MENEISTYGREWLGQLAEWFETIADGAAAVLPDSESAASIAQSLRNIAEGCTAPALKDELEDWYEKVGKGA